MEVKEFFTKLKQNCEKNNKNCEQCCLRVFCFLAPPSINDKMIDDACLYINQSANKKGSEGMSEENRAFKASVTLDTEQFERAIEKANDLVEVINKAKSLSNDLACMVQDLNFTPIINEKPEGLQ